jgi:hypothetical protein
MIGCIDGILRRNRKVEIEVEVEAHQCILYPRSFFGFKRWWCRFLLPGPGWLFAFLRIVDLNNGVAVEASFHVQ